ncbi:MAG: iron-containing alcohol dehydrogenase [Phycisphaerae bacterium]|nr:iron-containing alcohol dehydrogenase [Phycisphaerae bacterium]
MCANAFDRDVCELDALRRWLAARPEPLVPLTIRQIVIDPAVLDELPERAVTSRANRPASYLIMDCTPMRRNDASIKPEIAAACRDRLSDLQVIELGGPDKPPHADLTLAEDLARRIEPGSLVVTFGSGTVTDLAKHAMYLIEQGGGATFEHICCPTACTVTAFTSSMAVLAVDGVKRTIRSRAPDVVLVDLAMIRDAPIELTRAGFGDLMARCTAYGDWYLGDVFGVDETFNTVPFDLLARAEQGLLDQATVIGRRELNGLRTLADALMLAGIGMSIVDQTTPISGWEHVLSHYLDLRAMADDRPTGLHGAQVGASTLISALAFEELLNTGPETWSAPPTFDTGRARREIETHFAPFDPTGGMVAELWRDYAVKAERIEAGLRDWPDVSDRWRSGDLPNGLRRYVRPRAVVENALRRAEADVDLAATSGTGDRDLARSAILHGHRVRRRFTMGDVLELLGLLGPNLAERWLRVGETRGSA